MSEQQPKDHSGDRRGRAPRADRGGRWAEKSEGGGADRRGRGPGADRGSRRAGKPEGGYRDRATGRERPAYREPGAGRDRAPRSAQRPAERSRAADAPRLAAFETLCAVDGHDAYANLALPAAQRRHRLSGADAAFATELTYGTLRLRGRYDAIISQLSSVPLDQLDPPLLNALRMGMHQLFGMRVPVHAAVNESVGLARAELGAGPARLVNAVLRGASERAEPEWLADATAGLDPEAPEYLAVYESHPAWIVRALGQSLTSHGHDIAELTDLLAADNRPASVTLCARPGLVTRDDLLASLAGAEPGALTATAVRTTGGDPGANPAVADQRASVQDEASQLVALALVAVGIDGPDGEWLDLCAGPGGKAALLAAVAAGRGAHLVANELQAHRARLVEQNLAHFPDVEVRQSDGRETGAEEPGRYDRILLDAPCTGLGALRRRPEARWRKQPSDLPALTALQRELIESAVVALRPGGLLGYVTCSPHPGESAFQVADLLKRHPEFDLVPASEVRAAGAAAEFGFELPLDAETPAGTLQTWPHRHGTDAMFCAVLRKR